MKWDKALTQHRRGLILQLPMELTRALQERGYDRCTLEVTKAGLLIRPYVSEGPVRVNHSGKVRLPWT